MFFNFNKIGLLLIELILLRLSYFSWYPSLPILYDLYEYNTKKDSEVFYLPVTNNFFKNLKLEIINTIIYYTVITYNIHI